MMNPAATSCWAFRPQPARHGFATEPALEKLKAGGQTRAIRARMLYSAKGTRRMT